MGFLLANLGCIKHNILVSCATKTHHFVCRENREHIMLTLYVL